MDHTKFAAALASYLTWDADIKQAVVDYHLSLNPVAKRIPTEMEIAQKLEPAPPAAKPKPKQEELFKNGPQPSVRMGATYQNNNLRWTDDDDFQFIQLLERNNGWCPRKALHWAEIMGRGKSALHARLQHLRKQPGWNYEWDKPENRRTWVRKDPPQSQDAHSTVTES